MKVWERLGRIDKRFFYVLMAMAVVVPMVRPLGLPVPITDVVKKAFGVVDKLPAGSTVLLSFDYDAGNEVDLHPQARSLFRHLAAEEAKVLVMASTPTATGFAEQTLSVLTECGYQYGRDFVNLGFLAGQEPSLAAFAADPISFFTTDYHGNIVGSLAAASSIHNMHDFALVITLNAGSPVGLRVDHWVRIAVGAYERDLVVGCIGMIEATTMPYVSAGQVKGLLAGVAAAAQYEQLEGTLGSATIAMDQQSAAHLLVFGLVLLGNLVAVGIGSSSRGKRKGGA